MDADTRARLISLGIDPDKQEVPSSTAPTLADHLTALAELLKPAVAPEAAPLPAPVTQIEAAPAAASYVQTEASEPTPAQPSQPYRFEQVYTAPEAATLPEPVEAAPPPVVEAYRPIEQVYTAREPVPAIEFKQQYVEAPTAEPTAATEAPAPVEPTINYSPSGQYIELAPGHTDLMISPEAIDEALGNDPQVVEFKKNGTAMATQVDGNHYVKCAIQPLDYIMANKLGFVEGNIVKYATRWQDKDGVVDLKKARDYLDKLIAYVEQAES